jgi:DnaJ-class molecular chaperone
MGVNGYRDYFKVLGVDRSADGDAIKRAFRKLARQHHPDVNPGDKGAEARFKEISEAYEVLSDPDKRRRYEQFGQYWSQMGGPGGGGAAGFDVDFGRYGNFDEFINDLLGRFAAGPAVVFPEASAPVSPEVSAPVSGVPAWPVAVGLRSTSMPRPRSASVSARPSAVVSAPWP